MINDIRLNFDKATGANGTSLIRKKVKKNLDLLADDDSTEMNPSIQVTADTFLEGNGKAPELQINIESSSSSASQRPFGDAALSASAAIYALRDTSYPEFLVDSRVAGANVMMQAAQTLQQKRKLDNAIDDSNEEQWKKAKGGESSDGSLMLSATVVVTEASSAVQQDALDDMDDENIEWDDDGENED